MRRLVLISLVLAVAAAHAHADRDDAPRGIDIARQIDRANAGFKGVPNRALIGEGFTILSIQR